MQALIVTVTLQYRTLKNKRRALLSSLCFPLLTNPAVSLLLASSRTNSLGSHWRSYLECPSPSVSSLFSIDPPLLHIFVFLYADFCSRVNHRFEANRCERLLLYNFLNQFSTILTKLQILTTTVKCLRDLCIHIEKGLTACPKAVNG